MMRKNTVMVDDHDQGQPRPRHSRALLRKTRHIRVAAFRWRWHKKGVKKRGGWFETRSFLAFFPAVVIIDYFLHSP